MIPSLAQWQNLLTLKPDLSSLNQQVSEYLHNTWPHRHGHFDDWLSLIANIPSGEGGIVRLNTIAPQVEKSLTEQELDDLLNTLRAVMPWRKGPFSLFGIDLDCEWRSHLKFSRLEALGIDFTGKDILDVGCGNGYFMMRMLGAGANLVAGIDPSWHYFAQFLLLQRLFILQKACYLPLTLDDVMPTPFDIVLSMGVLYHRRDPLQHLWQLKECLPKGGQMVVETLVVDGDERTVLTPPDRYAGMRNVWFIPSVASLKRWLERLGLNIESVSEVVATTAEEQRQTQWMDRMSLSDFMQPDFTMTQEGLPPPKRVIIVARR